MKNMTVLDEIETLFPNKKIIYSNNIKGHIFLNSRTNDRLSICISSNNENEVLFFKTIPISENPNNA